MTHDYKRNGVTTLFAALNVLTGKVLSMTHQLHRPKPFIWTAKASHILAKVTRARAALNKNTSN